MSNTVNPNSYLRSSRDFPEDTQALRIELNKAYIDTSSAVNIRTIGIYSTGRPAINGESWYITANKQQALRQVYPFAATGSIPHGLNTVAISLISPKSYGNFTDGTNSYGAIYASNMAIPGQVTFYVTPTNIVVIAGAGAPSISSGMIVLEWISQV